MKRILMHTCCGPCSTYVIKRLREEGFEDITSYWYNLNIHPYAEYKQRLDSLKKYTEMVNIPLVIEDYYGVREFTKAVSNNIDGRCSFCYRKRLETSVKYAKEHGFDCFTTTLLVSIYQKHDEIIKVCQELSKEYDIEFVYFDFRVGFYEGQKMAREAGLYMQKYCGCIYSEEEAERQREERKNKKLSKSIK
jgi:predicted adenine nucleotide alpha hydrolase (AANH) superfamily ATPase